ncbi:MAG: 2Fe-2S iron-sulfur cluster binding domain-containing protein [Phyllobacteriaceae bacterium]|nr:2Fe-2S iron-sulfur cluster binding domain-containing protein [Phyllobacteriaceae bacterium]
MRVGEAAIAHYLTLSRVARLVRIPRAMLQRMAQDGVLATFDGQMELSEVLRVFPDIALDDDTEIRRVEEIKAAAVNKTPAAQELPDAETLAARLKSLSRDYARAKVSSDHSDMAQGWLLERIAAMREEGRMPAAAADELAGFLRREFVLNAEDRARRERLIAEESRLRIMSATVTLLPKGRTFDIDGRETILEAGLRAGLPLAYGCSNGNCGDCKARVVSGEAVKVKPHDHVFTREDKADNVILTCAYGAIGDLTLETGSPGVGDIPVQDVTAKVRGVDQLGPGVLALHLMTARSERLRFLAGQRVIASIGELSAELPVASCPCEERRIELHVRGDDAFARAAAALKPNAEVKINGPHGTFVLDDESTAPVLLIAIGAGFAPIKSLMQHALALEQAPTIALLRQADASGPYQQNLTRSYAESLDHFFCRPVDGDWDAALADIAQMTGALAGQSVFAAGPAEALAAAKAKLLAAGMAEAAWKEEAVG